VKTRPTFPRYIVFTDPFSIPVVSEQILFKVRTHIYRFPNLSPFQDPPPGRKPLIDFHCKYLAIERKMWHCVCVRACAALLYTISAFGQLSTKNAINKRFWQIRMYFETCHSSVVIAANVMLKKSFFSMCISYLRSRKLRLTTVGDPPRWPRDTPLSTKVSTTFRRQVVVAQSV
jgi:hypothetical protein